MGKYVKDWRELSRKSYKPFPVNTRPMEPEIKATAEKAYLKASPAIKKALLKKYLKRRQVKESLVEMRLLPRDYARVRAGEHLSHLEKFASMGKNVARTSKRDIRGLIKQQKMRSDADPRMRGAKILDKSGLYHYVSSDKQKKAKYFLGREQRAKRLQAAYAKDLSYKIGAGALGAAALSKGMRAFSNWRNKARRPIYHRQYDVYPEHGYAAVGIQPYNQPYYDEPMQRSGPPTHVRAQIGGGIYEAKDSAPRLIVKAPRYKAPAVTYADIMAHKKARRKYRRNRLIIRGASTVGGAAYGALVGNIYGPALGGLALAKAVRPLTKVRQIPVVKIDATQPGRPKVTFGPERETRRILNPDKVMHIARNLRTYSTYGGAAIGGTLGFSGAPSSEMVGASKKVLKYAKQGENYQRKEAEAREKHKKELAQYERLMQNLSQ
jgi:hypothetical protein